MLHAGEGGTDWIALADPFGFSSWDAYDHKGLDLRNTGAPFSQLAKCTKCSGEEVAKLATSAVIADEKSWPSTNQRGRETFWVAEAAVALSTPGRQGGHFLRHPLIQAPSHPWSPLLRIQSMCSFPPGTVSRAGRRACAHCGLRARSSILGGQEPQGPAGAPWAAQGGLRLGEPFSCCHKMQISWLWLKKPALDFCWSYFPVLKWYHSDSDKYNK